MNPVCFTIGSRPIYWYGVMVAASFLITVVHWSWLARREGRPEGFGSELGFWIMLSGILGARVAYIVANLDYFMTTPWEMVRIDKGGLIWYGGFLGASLALIIFARRNKEPLMKLADFTISGVPLGHAIGRIGCFLNGCCYGTPTHGSWAVYTADAWRYPVQLYEAVFNLLVYGILLWIYRRNRINGRILAAYLLLYPVGRFFLEFLRGDERIHWLGFNVAQEISLVLFVTGILLWLALGYRKAPRE